MAVCSDGNKVSESTIKRKLSNTYRQMYEGEPHPRCRGCGCAAQGSAHIVPKSICKSLGKTEYIWNPANIIPACHRCNSIIESYKSPEFRNLHCFEQILQVTKLIDYARYISMCELWKPNI